MAIISTTKCKQQIKKFMEEMECDFFFQDGFIEGGVRLKEKFGGSNTKTVNHLRELFEAKLLEADFAPSTIEMTLYSLAQEAWSK